MDLKYRVFRNTLWALSYLLGMGLAKYAIVPLAVHWGLVPGPGITFG